MRSALRWTSLGIVAAALYWLGAQGFHHRHFQVFLAIVLALAAAIVLIFIVTDAGESQD